LINLSIIKILEDRKKGIIKCARARGGGGNESSQKEG
jgi:hypothetical protein